MAMSLGKVTRQRIVCLLVACLTSQQHASVSQGRICSDNFTCCHTEIEVSDPTFYLTQSQYTDTGLTSPSADPITPGAWQGSHWSANFEVTGMTRPRKIPAQAGFEPGTFRSRGGRLTTRSTRRSRQRNSARSLGKVTRRWNSARSLGKVTRRCFSSRSFGNVTLNFIDSDRCSCMQANQTPAPFLKDCPL